jgi:hypothetical protein
MAKLDRLKLLLCAVNGGAYGTDAAPVVGDAIRAYDFSHTFQATRLDDDAVQPHLGAGDTHLIGKHLDISFKVRAVGAAAAGTPPPFGSLLRICGLSETVDAGVSVTYEPVSTGFEDGTLYFWRDNKKRALTGVRGTVSIVVERSNVPYLDFAMRGLYTAPEQAAILTPDWSTWRTPEPAEPARVDAWAFHGAAPILQSLRLSLAHEYPFISRVNQERVDITARAAEGEVVIEEPDLATLDMEALAVAHAKGALLFRHGTVAGQRVEISAPAAQIVNVAESESEGTAMQTGTLSLKPVLGNDEFKLTFL